MNQHEKFIKESEKVLTDIIDLFKRKNKSYGASDDLFYNFRQTALMELGDDSWDSMFKIANIYKGKHQCALTKGIHVPECAERLQDIIVYSLLQLAMIREEERNVSQQEYQE